MEWHVHDVNLIVFAFVNVSPLNLHHWKPALLKYTKLKDFGLAVRKGVLSFTLKNYHIRVVRVFLNPFVNVN